MDYEMLANELLEIRGRLLKVPANQKLSQMLKGELFVLNYLKIHEAIVHPKELSENLCVSTARIANLLNRMEEKDLICRLTDPEDSRQVIVRLTEKGNRMIEKARDDVLMSTARMLENLGPEDAEAYIRIQKKIYQSFEK